MTDKVPSKPMAAADLSPEAIALAARMYNAARCGDIEILHQALLAGLPSNMTNEKGDSLVSANEMASCLIFPASNPLILSHSLCLPLIMATLK